MAFRWWAFGDKAIFDTGFRISVCDLAKRLLDAFEPDGLVVGDAGAFTSGPFEQVFDIGIAFEASKSIDSYLGTSAIRCFNTVTLWAMARITNKTIMRLLMEIRDEFQAMVAILKAERDKANLKTHLATMEFQKELEQAEDKWGELEDKISAISDGAVEASDEYIAKVTIEGEALTKIYKSISERLSE